ASASGLDRVDSDGFDILPGPAARLAFTAPIPEARRNMAMAGVEVEVLDAFGNRSSGASTAITLALVEAPRGGS
ncbi:MAG: hypothetical protein GWN85_43550, partial [Gemmatimonadetes bacterium]|nr:hypothetical protein [Gemmatimonadota bacterium]NIR42121.1 hypothetical protein [Actinomycetota bacterium]NIS37282.1 hypothetical protein [Actinomycetota bacterium]NIU71723.1 hypothetical protein [Actinomycetota bacterium]NIV91022.1 hypothetical protein [Actinomycetota bacterium]